MMSSNGDMLIHSPADLGSAIRERRKQLGLDQSELAEQVGVSRQWVVEVEKGKPRAEVGLILRTLRALGIRLDAGTSNTPPQRSAARERSPSIDLDAVIDRARGKPRDD
jgi:HTH-type transcriptional regulator/antitoxin HipB